MIKIEWLTRYVPAVLFTLLACWFLSVMLFGGGCNAGSAAGLLISGVGAVCFYELPRLLRLLAALRQSIPGRIFLTVTALLLVLSLGLASAFSVLMLRAANRTPPEGEPLPVIVLGCKVNGDTPSRMLRRRLQTAQDYLIKHPNAVCVVSGGQGGSETRTEGSVMRDWLVAHGISPNRIVAEERSVNTRQNLQYSKEMLENAGYDYKKAVLVTDGYHQYRASLMAEKVGITAYAWPAKTELHLLPTYWIREWLGLCKYFVFERGN